MTAQGSVLRADGVSFGYNGQLVLEDVSLGVERKEFVALVGPNGSGKSTLIRVLSACFGRCGSTSLFGVDPRGYNERWRLGYVPQRPQLAASFPRTVKRL